VRVLNSKIQDSVQLKSETDSKKKRKLAPGTKQERSFNKDISMVQTIRIKEREDTVKNGSK
jgi:hypothetical protein